MKRLVPEKYSPPRSENGNYPEAITSCQRYECRSKETPPTPQPRIRGKQPKEALKPGTATDLRGFKSIAKKTDQLGFVPDFGQAIIPTSNTQIFNHKTVLFRCSSWLSLLKRLNT